MGEVPLSRGVYWLDVDWFRMCVNSDSDERPSSYEIEGTCYIRSEYRREETLLGSGTSAERGVAPDRRPSS